MSIPERSPEDERRLLRLRVIAKAMLATAFLTTVFVFVSAFLSGDKPGDPTPGMRVTIDDIAIGDTRTLIWEGRPVIVQRRTPDAIAALRSEDPARDAALRDPRSTRSEQPDSADTALRSVQPEWFVAIAIGTDYGCPVKPVAAGAAEPEPEPESAVTPAFVDDCRGSRYDAAGRVLAGEFADKNLVVPAHRIDGGSLVLGGG